MKTWITLTALVLALTACGKDKDNKSAPPQATDSSTLHKPDECPTGIEGQFVNVEDLKDGLDIVNEDGQLVLISHELTLIADGHVVDQGDGITASAYCSKQTIIITIGTSTEPAETGVLRKVGKGLTITVKGKEPTRYELVDHE